MVFLSFFYYALWISVVLSLLFALVSFILVTKRLTFLAIGTEHAAFGGVGLAKIFGWDQFLTTTIFCSVITVFAGRSHTKSSDMGISMLFSGAMAFGMILLSIDGGGGFNLMGFLFGDLIGITLEELLFSSVITGLILLIVLPALGKILFLIFDRDLAIVQGVHASFWDTVIYIVLSVSIVLGIKLVGILLVAAMTVLPATFSLLWHQNVWKTLMIAFVFSLCTMVGGIVLSFIWDVAPGPLIVALAVLCYFMTVLSQKMIKKVKT